MTYKVWSIYSAGVAIRFYIINQDTKAVQSTWSDLLDARRTCAKLNEEVSEPSSEEVQ